MKEERNKIEQETPSEFECLEGLETLGQLSEEGKLHLQTLRVIQ